MDDPFAFVVVVLAVVGVAVAVAQISTTKTKNSFTIFSPDSIVPSMFKSLQSSETTNRCDSFFLWGLKSHVDVAAFANRGIPNSRNCSI